MTIRADEEDSAVVEHRMTQSFVSMFGEAVRERAAPGPRAGCRVEDARRMAGAQESPIAERHEANLTLGARAGRRRDLKGLQIEQPRRGRGEFARQQEEEASVEAQGD